MRTLVFCASGFDERQNLVEQLLDAHRLEPQVFGPRELQEPLHHLVEPPDFALDDLDVLQRIVGLGALRRTRFGEAKATHGDRLRLARTALRRIFVRRSSR